MNEVPLKTPSGETKAWLCSVCGHVFSFGNLRSRSDPELEEERKFAKSCCTCHSCGKEMPNERVCEDCRRTEEKNNDELFERCKRMLEDSLAKASDRDAAMQLADQISVISEDMYCAGWLGGVEFIAWELVLEKSSLSAVFELENLHKKARGWWHWPTGSPSKVFVTDEEWSRIYEKRCRA